MPRKHLCSQSQAQISMLLNYLERKKQEGGGLLNINAVHELVAEALGISLKTIQRIKKRGIENPTFDPPTKKRVRKSRKTKDLPESSKMEVRNTIYNMYKNRKHVTLKSINEELQSKEIVHMQTSTLSILLKDLGFKYKKENNRRALTERLNVACMRNTFLRKYILNSKALYSRDTVFLDETWIYSKGSRTQSWQDKSPQSVRKPEGYDGKRYIILHAGTKEGFINGAELLFASRSATSDYHGEMNSARFIQWLTDQLIPNLKEPSLIVMDNAPYHSVILNKEPSASCRKSEILEWLQTNNVTHDVSSTKVELLGIVKMNRKEKICAVDENLREHGHKVLRFPAYHCDFNAIELIWAKAKGYYNTHIGRDGYGHDMWDEALKSCDTNMWDNCIKHTEELIKKWYEREQYLADLDVNPLIINIGEDSDSDSDMESS